MIDFNHGIQLKDLDWCCTADKAFAWRNDFAIWRWCRQNDLITEKKHKEWFDRISVDSSIKMYAIVDGPKMCGVCGLTDIDRVNQRAEFSLYIGPEYQGNGFGEAALKTLLSHGFLNQNLNVIWGETFEGNPAYNMFTRIGLRDEGKRRQFYFRHGSFIDAYLVSMTRAEFMEAKWRTAQV